MIKYLSKIFYILSERKRGLIVLVFSFVLVSILEVFGIGIIGPFISLASKPELIEQNNWLNSAYQHSGLNSKSNFIALVGTIVIIIFCLKSFISWRVQAAVFYFTYRQKEELTKKLMSAYLSAPYTFHLNQNTSHIIQNVVIETKQFANSVLIPLLTAISNLFIVLFLIALLVATNFATIVIIFGTIVPLIILFNSFKTKIALWGKEVSQAEQATVRIVNHSLGGIKETKILGCAPYFERQVGDEAKRFLEASSKFYAYKLLPRNIIESLLVIFIIGFIAGSLIVNNNIQNLTGTLGVFALASIRLIPAFSNITNSMGILKNASFVLNKLYLDLKEIETLKQEESLSLVDEPEACENSLEIENLVTAKLAFENEIVLKNIEYCYPQASENALENLSLTLRKGESIGLIGKSGAGKTTLVDVVLGLLIPQSGDIKVDGISVYDNLSLWQNLIGYIPQSIFLIDDSIEKNIAFGVPDSLIDRRRLEKAIRAAQLEELVTSLPQGIRTMVGERGVLLSGGQRQRIGIARALYYEREILVLDEATAALDNETETLVTEAIKSLARTKTTIIIAHRLSTVEHCDRIYEMERGRIIRSGSYREVVLNEAGIS